MSNNLTKTNTKIKNRIFMKGNGLHNNAEIMYRQKGFIHHYIGEEMEENEFVDALENIKDLINEYEALNFNINKEESSKEKID